MKHFLPILFFFTAIFFFEKNMCGEGCSKEIVVSSTFNVKENKDEKSSVWTKSYKKIFSHQEQIDNAKLEQLLFFKDNVTAFSQLIFSWNSVRPEKGYFTFYSKVRNSKTGLWSQWIKMFEWGKNHQRSFLESKNMPISQQASNISSNASEGNCFGNSSENSFIEYLHVRLETGSESMADAFKIGIKAEFGADLGQIKAVCACLSDFGSFVQENEKSFCNLKSVHIKNVPKFSQRLVDHKESARICSPTSCCILASFLNNRKIDAVDFADSVFDNGFGKDGAYGNWIFNVAELYCKCEGKFLFFVQRLNSFFNLHQKLLSNLPVVVSIRGKIEGGQKVYEHGHLIVVVGYDSAESRVICHDPAFYTEEQTFIKYKLVDFLKAWENSKRLAYVANFKN